jgi:glycerophosphoryl diester phosphodiesterase
MAGEKHMDNPLRIGHRGAAGHAPENTLLSVETALSFGVDVVEIDVHRSLDGHLIVMHDERVDRTTNGSGYIRDMTLEQIQLLETTLHQRVPALTDVLNAVTGRASLMIDIKVRDIVCEIADLAASITPQVSIYYASFLHSELLRLRDLDPAAKTIALIEATPVAQTAFALDCLATHAGIGFESLEPGFIRELKDAGIGVFTFTVDDPRDIRRARLLDVDGIISNFPDRLRIA